METKSVFGVLVRNVKTESIIEVFSSNLIDEACAFALSLFRSVNVTDLNIVVFTQSDGKVLVTFSRHA